MKIEDFGSEEYVIETTVSLLKKLQCDSPIYFDVGANNGQYARSFMQNFDGGESICFEPNISLLPEIEANLKPLNGWNFVVEPIALGSSKGLANFNIYNDHTASSILPVEEHLKQRSRNYTDVNVTEVVTDVLDSFAHNVPQIDYLKVDAQGYDLEVLKGGFDALKNQKINVITVEFTVASSYKAQFELHELFEYMHSVDYKLFNILRLASTDRGFLYYGDACFISAKCWKLLNWE